VTFCQREEQQEANAVAAVGLPQRTCKERGKKLQPSAREAKEEHKERAEFIEYIIKLFASLLMKPARQLLFGGSLRCLFFLSCTSLGLLFASSN
jgi:hypothetical protein